MHAIRPWPTCRASNPFSPSIALWQHFVAPNEHLLQLQRKAAFATEAARSHDDRSLDSDRGSGLAELKNASGLVTIKRIKTGKGNWQRTYIPLKPGELSNQDQRTSRRGHVPGARQDAEKLLVDAKNAYDTAQDYQGVTVQPIHLRGDVKESKLPWVPSNRERIKSAQTRLELEIQAFHEYVRPNRAESIARKHIIEQVRLHVQSILPEYVLEVFGSERTGVAFAGSDIDLRLVPKDVMSNAAQAKLPPTPEDRTRRRKDLGRLYRGLIYKHKYDYLLPTLRWARYPLITMQDRTSGLDIQLVLSNDTSVSREWMQRYMNEYSYLPQLYSVVKATMDVRGLSDVFRGGIGSYSLFMMIVASLKHKPHPRNNAEGALIFFLRFWSTFKAEEHGVSIEPPEFFDKSEQVVMHAKAMSHIEEGKTRSLPTWMLTLRDPADDTNDLGRKTIAWKHVRATFQNLAEKLQKDLKANTRPSFLAPHVGPIYLLQKARRKRLTEYGNYVATEGSKNAAIGDIGKKFRKARAMLEEQAAVTLAAAESTNETAELASRKTPYFQHLAAIAQAIKDGETMNEQSARDVEAVGMAKEAGKSEQDGINPWLKEIVGESDHQETGQALSDVLGLDKK
ncbi:hypothetical protein EKO04_005643 [Ascochyta lentis]|uniref:Poly(A) RNA polymerase mitochondrial-like central palm domain-containing protein n=1 Tax=Ascochyta lentis TaxID=205686 RepID=A0A8H7J1T9_9PLEO|nr:hypothetical protein EKO04_005643 [Ascochyta lentis]